MYMFIVHVSPGQVPSTSSNRDDAFQEEYRGIINSFSDESLVLMGNDCKSKLNPLGTGTAANTNEFHRTGTTTSNQYSHAMG